MVYIPMCRKTFIHIKLNNFLEVPVYLHTQRLYSAWTREFKLCHNVELGSYRGTHPGQSLPTQSTILYRVSMSVLQRETDIEILNEFFELKVTATQDELHQPSASSVPLRMPQRRLERLFPEDAARSSSTNPGIPLFKTKQNKLWFFSK